MRQMCNATGLLCNDATFNKVRIVISGSVAKGAGDGILRRLYFSSSRNLGHVSYVKPSVFDRTIPKDATRIVFL